MICLVEVQIELGVLYISLSNLATLILCKYRVFFFLSLDLLSASLCFNGNPSHGPCPGHPQPIFEGPRTFWLLASLLLGTRRGILILWDLSPLRVCLTHSASWRIKELCQSQGLICHFRASCLLTLQNSRRIWQQVFSDCSSWMHKGQSQVGQQLAWKAFRVRNHICVSSLLFPLWLKWEKAEMAPSEAASSCKGGCYGSLPVMASDTILAQHLTWSLWTSLLSLRPP